MSSPFDFFDKIFYINLDSRPDRRESMEKQLKKYNLSATRFNAVRLTDEDNADLVKRGCIFRDHDRPEYAPRIKSSTLSHLSVLFFAKLFKAKNVLVLEDDVIFHDDILQELPKCTEELSQRDWDMFFLGLQPLEAQQVSENLALVQRATSSHAYCINGHYIDTAIKALDYMRYPVIDVVLGHMHRSHKANTFMAMKELATQPPGDSDIEGNYQDLTQLTQNRYRDLIKRL